MTFETAAMALGAFNTGRYGTGKGTAYHPSIPLVAFVSTESVLAAIDKRIQQELEGTE